MSTDARRIMIVAGEASADRYAARLVRHIGRSPGMPAVTFFGTGGDGMQQAGVRLLCHLRDLAQIGPREALSHMLVYYRTYRALLARARIERPAVAVLLDFPDFNLRLVRPLRRMGVPVLYYVSPQLWAWRKWRIRTVRRNVDRMLVILPFEEDFYRGHGIPAEFVGHPILEEFHPSFDRRAFDERLGLDPRLETLALLPGSRRKEVDHILPVFLEAVRLAQQRRRLQAVVSVAPSVALDQVSRIARNVLHSGPPSVGVHLVREDSREILANTDFALVKSGTSTLEAALVGNPFLIAYRISPLSWHIGKLLIRSRFKGLVNLIAGDLVVPEYMQGEASPDRLAAATLEYLEHPRKREEMIAGLRGIRDRLGSRRATEVVADRILDYL